MNKIGTVLINYNSEEEVVKFIKNELTHINYDNKIVIVNNSNSTNSKNKIVNGLEKEGLISLLDTSIFIITKNENLGYAKANNFGALFLKEKFNPDNILFSNTDITFKDKDVVDVLIKKLKTLPDNVAVIGPRVVGLDGNDQSPHYTKISFFRYFLWSVFPFIKGRVGVFKNKKNERLVNERDEGYCYWLSGCFIIVKVNMFYEVGMFDPKTFLYAEEKILAERLLKIEKRMYYYPNVNIIHEKGVITMNNINKISINKILLESEFYYYNTYVKIPKLFIKIAQKFIKYYSKI